MDININYKSVTLVTDYFIVIIYYRIVSNRTRRNNQKGRFPLVIN